MKSATLLRCLGAVIAFVLFALVLRTAGVGAVWALLRDSRGPWILAAAAVAFATIVVRGARLMFLLPPHRLSLAKAAWIAAATQSAAMFIPARLGELVLPWLLRREAGLDTARGLTIMVAARLLDLAALALWAVFGVIVVWGFSAPLALAGVALLLLPAVVLPVLTDRLHRFVGARAGRGRAWAAAAERTARFDAAMVEVKARPYRLAAAAGSSFAMWFSVWMMTWMLLLAMGLDWAPVTVAAGSALASLANLLPINLFANIGTLEAGWTAAFTALGYPLDQAAASGVSAHLWALIFVAASGAASWLMVIFQSRNIGSN